MIVQAAILDAKGIIYTAKRHHLIFKQKPNGALKRCPQGFVTDKGEFVDRAMAAKIAYNCGQIKEPKRMLFSEDIY